MKLLRNISFGLMGLMVLMLAVATCVEKMQGTPVVTAYIYGSPWFIALWAALAVAGIGYLLRRKLRTGVWLLHGAFILILIGALVTHLFGLQGSVHLRQGASEEVSAFTDADGAEHALPFGLRLKEFVLEYYPGTVAPMDFISTFAIADKGKVCEGRVSMNHIFRYRHYRFYQSGYDTDGQGTTLGHRADLCRLCIAAAVFHRLLPRPTKCFPPPPASFLVEKAFGSDCPVDNLCLHPGGRRAPYTSA